MNKIKMLSMLYAVALSATPFGCKPSSEEKNDSNSDDILVQNMIADASGLYSDSQVATNYVNKAKNLLVERGIPFKNWYIRYEICPNQEKLNYSLAVPTNEVPRCLSEFPSDFRHRIEIAPVKQLSLTGGKPKSTTTQYVLSFNLTSEQDGFEVSPWLKPSENDTYYLQLIGGDQFFSSVPPPIYKNKQSFTSYSDNKKYYFGERPGTSLIVSQNSFFTNLTKVSILKDTYSPNKIKKDYWFYGTPKELMDKATAQKNIVLTNTPAHPLDEEALGRQVCGCMDIKRRVENRLYQIKRRTPFRYTEMKYTLCGFENGYDPHRTFVTYKIPTDKGEKIRYFEMNQPQEKTPYNTEKDPLGSFTEISSEEFEKKTTQAKQNSSFTLSATRSIDGTTSIIVDGNRPECRYNYCKKMSMSYNPRKSKKWGLVITDVPHELFGFSAKREIQMVFDGNSRISCKEHYPSSKEIHLFSDKKFKENPFVKQKEGRN